ncbi:MAG: hypothetical protein ABIH35_00370 [Patescibacteria group bacterium]
MEANSFEENFGIDPERAEALRQKARLVVEGIVAGDAEAQRTWRQLDIDLTFDSHKRDWGTAATRT